jgi:putative ubiquitin-RnfH superfamily antitoxin RatB of RatAB toxin-antitoxin module
MRITVIRAWPRCHESVLLDLPDASTLADALEASGFDQAGVDGYAVFGERARIDDVLRDGDRVELLRPLQVDPKEARRRRAMKPTR